MLSIQGSTTPSRRAWFRTELTEVAFMPIIFFQQKISVFKYYDEYSGLRLVRRDGRLRSAALGR